MASPLPTRLLDVSAVTAGGTSQDPFLYIPDANERSEYVAPSYCWGEQGSEDFVLKQSTLKRKMETIPLSSLPQTLRDAITITKWLGFCYLWIDALCILQDSKEDWEKEAAVMGKVYFNAVVTIAASAASDSSQGFLLPREQFECRSPPPACLLWARWYKGTCVGSVYGISIGYKRTAIGSPSLSIARTASVSSPFILRDPSAEMDLSD